jgi:hypothetical protein
VKSIYACFILAVVIFYSLSVFEVRNANYSGYRGESRSERPSRPMPMPSLRLEPNGVNKI